MVKNFLLSAVIYNNFILKPKRPVLIRSELTRFIAGNLKISERLYRSSFDFVSLMMIYKL